MKRYRIIETKVPVLSRNYQGVVNFIPEIEHESTYHVEYLVIDKFLWMTFKEWVKVYFEHGHHSFRSIFKSIEEAQKYIEFREEQIKTNVVWKG
jgi:hypothetical protein